MQEDAERSAPPKERKARSNSNLVSSSPPAAHGSDPLQEARKAFAEGSRLLREMEQGVLPFARGPWTELRQQAEQILANLSGKKV